MRGFFLFSLSLIFISFHNEKEKKNLLKRKRHKKILTRSYRCLSLSAIASYFDFISASQSDHFRPSSFAISPTPYSGFRAFTLVRSSWQNQKNADLKISFGREIWIRIWFERVKFNTYNDRFGAFGSFMCFLFLPRPIITPFGGT